MKKSIFLVILIVLILLSSMMILFACDENKDCTFDKEVVTNEYLAKAATCTTPAYYYYSCDCGKHSNDVFAYGDALGHNYKEATCTKAKYCMRCKEVVGEALGHDYDNTNACKRCGSIRKKEETADEKNSTTFFNDLWTATNAIADEKITENDDIAMSLNLNVTLRVQNNTVSYKQINVGIKIAIIYDRQAADSAVMISLYDIKDNTEWLSLYFYLSDPYNIYLTFDKHNILIGFDTGYNGYWSDIMVEYFELPIIGNSRNKISIAQLMDLLCEYSGEGYTFGSFIDSVFKIASLTTNANIYIICKDLEPTLNSVFGIEHVIDDEGHFDVRAVFNSSTLKTLYKNVKIVNKSDGSKSYSLDFQLNTTLANTVASLISSSNPEIGKELINGTVVTLKYQTQPDGGIDGFNIVGTFKGLQYFDEKLNKYLYPILELDILDMDIAPIDASFETNKEYFNMPSQFTETNSLDISCSIDASGITFTPSKASNYVIETDDYKLDGKYNLRIQSSGDLNNDTPYMYMWFEKDLGDTKEIIAEGAYNGDTLIVHLDETVENIDGVSVIECIFDSLGYYALLRFEDMQTTSLVYDFSDLIQKLKESLLVQVRSGYYEYREGTYSTYSLKISLSDLLHYFSDEIGEDVSSATEKSGTSGGVISEEEGTVPITKKNNRVAMSIDVNSVVTMVKDIFVALYITYGDTYGIIDVSLPEGKTIMDVLTSWFKINQNRNPEVDWYLDMLGYSRKWFRVFTDLGIFDGYIRNLDGSILNNTWGRPIYKNYKLVLTNADVELMWEYVMGSKGYQDYVDYMTEKEKEYVDEDTYNLTLQKINALFWDKLIKFEGSNTEHWYEMLCIEAEKLQIVLDLFDGVFINLSGQVADTTYADIDLTVKINDEITREQLQEHYARLSAYEDIFDLGHIQLCEE